MTKGKYRESGLSGLKFFIATSSFAAMFGLWSLIANQERLSQLQMPVGQVPVQSQPNAQLVDPLPTLISLQLPDGQPIQLAQPTPELRSVSAPPPVRASNNPVVVSNSGRSAAPGNTVTTTSSSG